jgi:hypothetical protein
MMPRSLRRRAITGATAFALLIGIVGAPAAALAAGLDDEEEYFCLELRSSLRSDPEFVIELIDKARAPAQAQLDAGVPPSEELLAEANKCTDLRQDALARIEEKAVLQRDKDKAAEDDPTTWSEDVQAQWAEVLKRWVVPLGGVAALAGAFIVAFFVLSRFLSLTPFARRGIFSRLDRGAALVSGLIGIGASAVGLSVALAAINESVAFDGDVLSPIVGWALIAVVSMYFFARWLASRLKLTVDVYDLKGKSDWGTARAVNLLSSLAGSPARGLEVPVGSDVDALVGAALPESGASAILAKIQAVIRFIFLGTPWKISIRTDSSDLGAEPATQATATIIHNGETVDQAFIDVSKFGLPEDADKTDAVYTLAAAAVIVALRRRNAGFEGLAGTTRWRSLGLQAIATTIYATDLDKRNPLLTSALEVDSGNLMARYTVEAIAHRWASDAGELGDYKEELWDELAAVHRLPHPWRRPLDMELRIRVLLAVVALNLHAASGAAGVIEARDRKNLETLLKQVGRTGMTSPLAQQVRLSAAVAWRTMEQIP